MHLRIFILFLIYMPIIENKENCGCNVDRGKAKYIKNEGDINLTSEEGECRIDLPSDKESRMVLVPENTYQFGTDDIVLDADKEGPKQLVKVKSFYLDKYEVSNIDFKSFVDATQYKTEAEVYGDSFVFALFLNDTFKEQLTDYRVMQAPWWYKVNGSSWKNPYGPDSDLEGLMDHPVIHVSWNDAKAYCAWRNGRLPTETEWEAACRGGHNNTKYPWGDKLYPEKQHRANIWQGTFPNHNSAKDGFIGTSPIDMFAPNDFGLYNMAGNVWEWTEDSWQGRDPKEKVKKGGSYLCHRSYCYRYRCSARSHNTEDSSAGNLGFRCAKST
ncbi:formylglycine-generating enzyme [Aricia agestis]|uniref:formylglycine-generating enzyme n=1 Tax=Aricia agestis TaxID=91739 RepID=UPI001C204197|nr:formylglycine-generating enzyme [Aricia agestis]